MKYVTIFVASWQDAFTDRSRSFVWFLVSLINPFLLLVYWIGLASDRALMSRSTVMSYYLFLVIASSFIMAHVEEVVAYEDIQKGGLSRYITKPISYFWYRFLTEFPWRIIQGFFGVIVFLIIHGVFHVDIALVHTLEMVVFSFLSISLGMMISFIFKMILGLTALWTTDFSGLAQFIEVITLIFGGFVLPLYLLPEALQIISMNSPFASMIYFPIMAVSGALTPHELFFALVRQCVWLAVCVLVYRIAWNRGVKRFTGVGL